MGDTYQGDAFHTLPKGTLLYRSGDELRVGDDIAYFTLDRSVAEHYAKIQNTRVIRARLLKDVTLLDLSKSDAWGLVQEVINTEFSDPTVSEKMNAAQKLLLGRNAEFYMGTDRAIMEDPAFVEKSYASGLFPDGKLNKVDCDPPTEKCRTTMTWNGLTWGPEKGEFKRVSSSNDINFLSRLREKCMKVGNTYPILWGCYLDGVYAPPLPSPTHYHEVDSKRYEKVFHGEIALFGTNSKITVMGGKRNHRKRTFRSKSKRKATRRHG